MAKIITAEQAAALIPDGATVGASGMQVMWAEEVGVAIEQRFLATAQPRNITLVHGSGIGNWVNLGTHHLGHEGLVAKWIGAHTGAAPAMAHLIEQNKCQAYCIPQGVVVQLYREIAAKRPGIITKVGLGTFIDPRLEGGKINSVTTEDYVQLIQLAGEEWLFYPAFPIDVALIRGTTADENGNLTMDEEALLFEHLPLAQAAKNSGGIVIAQVKYLAEAETLHPKKVRVPGGLVDYVVVAARPEQTHMQTAAEFYNPAFSGDVKMPLGDVERLPMNERLIVARRAAAELHPHVFVNCGVGLPDGIGSVAAEEGVTHLITLTTEAGAIGGAPGVDTKHGRANFNFGVEYNPAALIEHQVMFDFYDGGGLDVAFLGLAQTDKLGNVNVSRFSGRAMGVGGFVNIAQGAKKLVFCGTFTAGHLEVTIVDGVLKIVKEGTVTKFIDAVEEVTFSGPHSATLGQLVVYVTERAVFELRDGRMTLVEIAPGIDVERDVIAHMDFRPEIASDLRTMAPEMFALHWGKLREIIETNGPLATPKKRVPVAVG
ncbi:MAG: CoA-transferase [Candidatus Velthaea sp.]|jgi:propionate CoA-transferase